jgi:hypothetical protein
MKNAFAFAGSFRLHYLFFAFICLFTGCQKDGVKPGDREDAATESARKATDAAAAAACACPSGWDCRNFEATSTVITTGKAFNWYNNEAGYARAAWPRRQANARLKDAYWCTWDYDNRLYSSDPFFANPANIANVRLRRNNHAAGWHPLGCRGTPFADYFTAGANHPLYAAGTRYVRVTIGMYCYTDDLVFVGK